MSDIVAIDDIFNKSLSVYIQTVVIIATTASFCCRGKLGNAVLKLSNKSFQN